MCPHRTSRIAARLPIGAALIATLVAQSGCSDDDDRGVTFTAGPTPISFAAAQDGDGPWLVVKAASDGTYSFVPAAATYGIAVVCEDGASFSVAVVQATVAETRSQRIACEALTDETGSLNGTGTITGTIAAPDSTMTTEIHVDGHVWRKPLGPYKMERVPVGEWDVFAVRGGAQGLPLSPDRIIRKNAVTVAASSDTALDFDFATDGFAPESHAVSIEGALPTEHARVQTTLRNTTRGTFVSFGSNMDSRFHAIPPSQLRSDDIHFVDVIATGGTSSGSRAVRRWAVSTSDFTASLPPMPAAPLVVSDATEPYIRMRGTLPPGADADRYDFLYRQALPGSYATWITTLSRGYVEATTNEYTLPDLSALAGFSSAWGLRIATPVEWAFTTTASEAGARALLTTDVPADELDGRVEAITHQSGRFPR